MVEVLQPGDGLRVVCKGCNALLRFGSADVRLKNTAVAYAGETWDPLYYIECPECGRSIDVGDKIGEAVKRPLDSNYRSAARLHELRREIIGRIRPVIVGGSQPDFASGEFSKVRLVVDGLSAEERGVLSAALGRTGELASGLSYAEEQGLKRAVRRFITEVVSAPAE